MLRNPYNLMDAPFLMSDVYLEIYHIYQDPLIVWRTLEGEKPKNIIREKLQSKFNPTHNETYRHCLDDMIESYNRKYDENFSLK